MSTFFVWENFPSLSERLASYELWGSFGDSFFFLSDYFSREIVIAFRIPFESSLPPPSHWFFLLAGLVLFWACPQFSFCLGNQTLISFWFRIRSWTCERRSSVQVPVGYAWILCVFIIFRLVRNCAIFFHSSCSTQKLSCRFRDTFFLLNIIYLLVLPGASIPLEYVSSPVN